VGNNRRAVVAAVAILLAVVAGIAAYVYVSGADSRARKGEVLVDAYVAGGTIPKGTSGQQALGSGLVIKQQVRRTDRPETALATTAGIESQVAAADIVKGQFLVQGSFVDQAKAESGLSDLASGMQALTISVDDVHGVAGFIQPGDHINILDFSKVRSSGGTPTAATPESQVSFLVQNVRVLAVGHQAVNSVPQTTAPGAAPPAVQGTGLLTLELSPTDAEKVVLGVQGTTYLSLVPKGFKPVVVAPVVDIINLGLAGVPPTNLIG